MVTARNRDALTTPDSDHTHLNKAVPAWVALFSALFVIIGAFGPWARSATPFGTITLNGIDTDDGKLVLGLGVAAIALMLLVVGGAKLSALPVLAVLVFAATVVAGAVDFIDIRETNQEFESESNNFLATAGWGIYLVLIASTIGTNAAAFQLVHKAYRSTAEGSAPVPSSRITVARATESKPVDDQLVKLVRIWLVIVLLFAVFGAIGLVLF
jgi:hypothetical protein